MTRTQNLSQDQEPVLTANWGAIAVTLMALPWVGIFCLNVKALPRLCQPQLRIVHQALVHRILFAE